MWLRNAGLASGHISSANVHVSDGGSEWSVAILLKQHVEL